MTNNLSHEEVANEPSIAKDTIDSFFTINPNLVDITIVIPRLMTMTAA